MQRISRSHQVALAACAVSGLLLAGCTVDEPDDEDAQAEAPEDLDDSELSFAVISHSAPGDSFWEVVQGGAEQSGAEHNVEITYSGDDDPAEQSQLIDNAVAQDMDGLVVSMANPDGIQGSVEAAVEADIPVITMNSGLEEFEEIGAITHVGQSEYMAGEAAGERLGDEDADHLVCVIHEAGNVGLEERCSGAADAFDGEAENLQVDISDAADARNTIENKLISDEDVDAILTLNPEIAQSAQGAIEDAGTGTQLATFDLSADITEAITAGDVLFAIDQQPYVQGYLPVTMLALHVRNGNEVGGGDPVYSGPSFVTEDNAEEISEFAERGTR